MKTVKSIEFYKSEDWYEVTQEQYNRLHDLFSNIMKNPGNSECESLLDLIGELDEE